MDGQKHVLGVKIDPEVAGDVEMLQDLVLAACNEASKKGRRGIAEEDGRDAGRHGTAPRFVLIRCQISRSLWHASSPSSSGCLASGRNRPQRIAFHIMRASRDDADQLSRAILDVKDKLTICTICNNIADSELCQYCRDPQRDQKVVCVVEDPNNIVGIEVTRQFNGLYHVLGGALSPLRGHRAGTVEDQEPGGPDREGPRSRK